ncbi:MAG TPA: HEAT repeat domain-containing protein, partial [Planctomycetota bacterium]|nr:HEAT repeat domain-containing protein [Planctomycetota bacterium]
TVLRDRDGDGVAEERKELLTDLGPVAPGHPGGFNDHIVSGLRYGMDGYLYVACGDKGVPLAHGTDGSRISLRGGGVVRMRPDGSELEVVARGLRNILDVAMDANGEMFTYDNTDDGLGWWTRVTHIVPGGYYGYPWDYHDQPGRFLAPMDEYGGGSPTGGLVKREGGWPAPYEGSLFFCEWGDQTLRRFELERDGGTFKVAKMEEFLEPGDVKDFHPTDVCESPDGRFLYISDWGYGGWVAKNETGRLWRVRVSDVCNVDPRLDKNATIAQRLECDGWRTRLLAQDEIVRTRDVKALIAALGAGGRVELHALHAAAELARRDLDKLPQADWKALTEATRSRLLDADPLLRRAALQTSEAIAIDLDLFHGHGFVSSQAIASLADMDMRVREAALRMLVETRDAHWGREASARAAAWSCAEQSPHARATWRRLAAGPMDPEELAHFFEDSDAQTLELLDAIEDFAVRLAETRRGALEEDWRGPFEDLEKSGICGLARGKKAGSHPRVRAAALHALGVLARVCEPWDGKWWSIAPAKLKHPARTVDWKGTELANATLAAALADPDAATRSAATAAVRETGDSRLAAALRQRIVVETDTKLRSGMLEALGELGSKEDVGLFARIARKSTDTDERVRALEIGARLGIEEMSQSALVLVQNEATVAQVSGASLELLSQLEPIALEQLGFSYDLALERSRHPSPVVRRASCSLLAEIEPQGALPRLLELVRDSEVRSAAFKALASLDDPRAARVYARGLGDEDPELRSVARRTMMRSKKALRPTLEAMVQRQEFSGEIVRELRGIYAGHQPILDWQIRGPFDADGALGKLEFSAEHAEASLAALKDVEARSESSSRADGMIDLDVLLGEKSNQTAYAFGEFESSAERDVELHVGSDDQVSVWLNGALVHEFTGARAFTAEADHFKAHLLAGKNQLALRIGQAGGDWSFALTVPEEGSGPLFESRLPSRPTPAEYAAFAQEMQGDPARGEKVIQDVNRTTCLRCHAIAGKGEHVGPDLDGLGARYSRAEIANSILSPSQRILDGYAAVSVLTKDDQMLFGQIKQDDAKGIVLIDTTGTAITTLRADVAEVRPSKLSVMPEGLCATMTTAEFADLVAYLSRKQP